MEKRETEGGGENREKEREILSNFHTVIPEPGAVPRSSISLMGRTGSRLSPETFYPHLLEARNITGSEIINAGFQ